MMEVLALQHYKTIVETAAQWGVSAHTIRNLCNNGKIAGALKRAGHWFIPEEAIIPLKNTKSDAVTAMYVGTKKRIFDSAIELFASYGFENVSTKDIAGASGVMQSAIYNHFPSKQNILDTMYEYYQEHFNDNKLSVEKMQKLLRTGTKEEFCSALMFTFESKNQEHYKRMVLLTRIIYMRLFQDNVARDLFIHMMNAHEEAYVQDILEYGVSIGILDRFDIPTYAKFIVGQRHIMGIKAFANSHYEPKQLEEEKHIMKMCSDMLPFLAAPSPNRPTSKTHGE